MIPTPFSSFHEGFSSHFRYCVNNDSTCGLVNFRHLDIQTRFAYPKANYTVPGWTFHIPNSRMLVLIQFDRCVCMHAQDTRILTLLKCNLWLKKKIYVTPWPFTWSFRERNMWPVLLHSLRNMQTACKHFDCGTTIHPSGKKNEKNNIHETKKTKCPFAWFT